MYHNIYKVFFSVRRHYRHQNCNNVGNSHDRSKQHPRYIYFYHKSGKRNIRNPCSIKAPIRFQRMPTPCRFTFLLSKEAVSGGHDPHTLFKHAILSRNAHRLDESLTNIFIHTNSFYQYQYTWVIIVYFYCDRVKF